MILYEAWLLFGCVSLNHIEHFLMLAFTITGYISISAFTSLIGIPIGITSSGLSGTKKYKSTI